MTKIIKKVLTALCMCAILTTLTGCWKSVNKDKYKHYVIIKLPTEEIVEGYIEGVSTYCNMVRIEFSDNTVYYTHASNVAIISEPAHVINNE